MPDADVQDALIDYAAAIRSARRANNPSGADGTALELLLAPRMQQLLERLLATYAATGLEILPEYRKGGIGRPDLAFKRQGEPARAFIELKQPNTSLDPKRLTGHDRDQFSRFRELPVWGFCNFHTIHLYRQGELQQQVVILPAITLDPATTDAVAAKLIRRHDASPFFGVLDSLVLAQPSPPRTAPEIAATLARAARLVRQVIIDQCRAGAPAALDDVRAEFRETLFAHAAAGGYNVDDEDELFGNAFAQTLAFGLLLALEAGLTRVDRDAYRALPSGTFPLLRATLRALTQDEILDLLGAAFDVLQDVVNVINPELLKARPGYDPILYFYEDFLGVFDPAAKKKHGVFFTPVPVVRFMVALTDRALRGPMATAGLLDPEVLILDPACGTGTFLIAAASAGAEAAEAQFGEGAVASELAALASRLHGFELLVGPYTVAHYRMLRQVASAGVVPVGRLPIFLADTLAAPTGAVAVTGHLGFLAAPIVAERAGADLLKRTTPVLAIIGNPPYRRLSEGEGRNLFSGWDAPLWNDLKQAVSDAGWGGELNTFEELSVAFWRWCVWKLFESEGAPGKGVICLITNRTFLAGHPYAGLRRMMRRRFDAVDIIDLRGDSRGARPAGIETDENVFQVQVGVCIVIATASGQPRRAGAEARVRYADIWQHGAFTAKEKETFLDTARNDPAALNFVDIAARDLEDFVPRGFAGHDWPSLTEIFAFWKSGIQTKRDTFVYAHSAEILLARWSDLALAADEAAKIFHDTGMNTAAKAMAKPLTREEIFQAIYRPLDRRSLMRATRVIDRIRPELLAAWGTSNRCLYAMPAGTGAGPAIWAHELIPDYHSFRGSYGGYAFPLYDRRIGPDADNFNPALIPGLSTEYGRAVTAAEIFNAITALLSATSYTARFAQDLEEIFAHVPFPADVAVFDEAVRIGGEIVALETFGRAAAQEFQRARMVGRASGVTLEILPPRHLFREAGDGTGFIPLQKDESLRLAGVSARAFNFSVSGYRVLYRWLEARQGEALDNVLIRAILDIVWRIEELLHWFDAADAVLAAAVSRPVTRAMLGMNVVGDSVEEAVNDEDE